MASYSRTSANKSAGNAALAADFNKLRTDLRDLLVALFGNDSPTDTWNIAGIKLDTITEQTSNNGVVINGVGFTWVAKEWASPGFVTGFAGGAAPSGWLICNGQAVSRTTYASLFAVIGTTFGVGNGTTTFNLPNSNGKTIVGYDNTQSEFNLVGKSGGAKTVALTVNNEAAKSFTTGHIAFADDAFSGSGITVNKNAGSGSMHEGSANTSAPNNYWRFQWGGGVAHDNLPPYLTMNVVIKY